MRESRQLRNKRLHTLVVAGALLKVPRHFCPPTPEPNSRSHVVNVLRDSGRDMVLFSGDIVAAGRMFPNVVLGEHKLLDLANRGIELYPLDLSPNVRRHRRSASGWEPLTCLLTEWPMRSGPIPDVINHSLTRATVDCAGEKNSITSSGVICWPKLGDPGVELRITSQHTLIRRKSKRPLHPHFIELLPASF